VIPFLKPLLDGFCELIEGRTFVAGSLEEFQDFLWKFRGQELIGKYTQRIALSKNWSSSAAGIMRMSMPSRGGLFVRECSQPA